VGGKRITVSFGDDAGDGAGIVGAETGDFAIAWCYMHTTTGAGWHYLTNPADNLDAGGRGSVDADHCGETYEIPAGACGLSIIQTAGTDDFQVYFDVE